MIPCGCHTQKTWCADSAGVVTNGNFFRLTHFLELATSRSNLIDNDDLMPFQPTNVWRNSTSWIFASTWQPAVCSFVEQLINVPFTMNGWSWMNELIKSFN